MADLADRARALRPTVLPPPLIELPQILRHVRHGIGRYVLRCVLRFPACSPWRSVSRFELQRTAHLVWPRYSVGMLTHAFLAARTIRASIASRLCVLC